MKPEEVKAEQERKPTTALYAALAKAQADLKAVDKASRNEYHKYNYASAEDMMTAATAVMGEHGLAFVCVGSKFDKQAQTMTASYVVTHENGGFMELGSHEITVHPDKGRPMDKAISTALTYLQAYTLRGVFNIPRVPEGTERDSTSDADIQAWESEQQKARKKSEDASKKEHAAKSKTLRTKGKLVNENAPEFFKAAGVAWSQKAKGQFMMWAANVDGWPARDVDAQIEVVDHSLEYLVEWKQMDETEALAAANDFGTHANGKPDHEARAEAAFDKAVEAGEA